MPVCCFLLLLRRYRKSYWRYPHEACRQIRRGIFACKPLPVVRSSHRHTPEGAYGSRSCFLPPSSVRAQWIWKSLNAESPRLPSIPFYPSSSQFARFRRDASNCLPKKHKTVNFPDLLDDHYVRATVCPRDGYRGARYLQWQGRPLSSLPHSA